VSAAGAGDEPDAVRKRRRRTLTRVRISMAAGP
jgi:hypothetical protein